MLLVYHIYVDALYLYGFYAKYLLYHHTHHRKRYELHILMCIVLYEVSLLPPLP
jgi:hypothetical protein